MGTVLGRCIRARWLSYRENGRNGHEKRHLARKSLRAGNGLALQQWRNSAIDFPSCGFVDSHRFKRALIFRSH